MRKTFETALRTLPGTILAGAGGAAFFVSVLTLLMWAATGRNADPESTLVGIAAFLSFGVAGCCLFLLWRWGTFLRGVLSTGVRLPAEVASVIAGRPTVVVLRLEDGSELRQSVTGRVALKSGDRVTVRRRSGQAWPWLIEELYG